MWIQEEFNKAITFAGNAHKDQKYCRTQASYLVHVSQVVSEAMALITLGKSENCDENFLVQCAALHDVIEDTDFTYTDIKNEFGTKVANGVLALSKNSNLDKSETMKDSINRIKQQPKEIAMVKLCDRITNMQKPPSFWNDAKITEYKKEAQFVLNELGYANNYLKSRLAEKIKAYNY